MLLFRCSELTDPFGGRTLVQRNYAIEEIAIGFIQNNYKKIWTVLMLKYQAVRMALGQIKRLDRSLVHGAPLDRGYRRKLVNALQCAVRALTAPLTEF